MLSLGLFRLLLSFSGILVYDFDTMFSCDLGSCCDLGHDAFARILVMLEEL